MTWPKRLPWMCSVVWLVIMSTVVVPATAADRDFMWEICSAKGRLYILGSIHLGRPDMYPLSSRIMSAYEGSSVLVVEVNVQAMDPVDMLRKTLEVGMLPDGETLTALLSAPTLAKAEEVGVDLHGLENVKPWMAAAGIAVEAVKRVGFEEELGVDYYFMTRALERDLPIKELESLSFQLELFDRLSFEEQDRMMFMTLSDLEKVQPMMDGLVESWIRGDAERFEDVFYDSYRDYPGMEKLAARLIYDRNRAWIVKIEKYLQSGHTHFMVVGAGHLVGSRGLLADLESMGYRVNQSASGWTSCRSLP
jgi:uncharacterized protein